MSDYGRLQEVVTIARSTDLTIDAAISDTELVVDSAGDFDEDGGTLQLNGVQLDYTAIEWGVNEDDPDTITLTEPLAVAADVDDNVQPVDGGLPVEDWYAVVDMGPGDSVYVPLTFAQRSQWPEGTYDPPVRVTVSDDLQNLEDAPGRPASVGSRIEAWNEDEWLAGTDDTDTPGSLTYLPKPHSLMVFKNGIRLANSEFTLVDNVATVLAAEVTIRTGDKFSAYYDHDPAAEVVGTPLQPPVGSLFDEIMARNPVGFWNYEGDYTDDSGNGYTLTPGGGNAFVSSIVPTEPSGQSANLAPNLSWSYSGTPVAAIDAIAGVLSYVAMGHYTDNSVVGHFIGQAAPSGGGNHHFLFKYTPTTEQVTVEWYDGTARSHVLDAPGTFDADVLWGITADGTDVILYINGLEADRVAQAGAPQAQAGGNYIAVSTDGATNNRWRGVKDADALFATDLSADDHLSIARAAGVA